MASTAAIYSISNAKDTRVATPSPLSPGHSLRPGECSAGDEEKPALCQDDDQPGKPGV